MTKIAAQLLADVYGVSGSSVQVIPHGVPAVPFDRDPSTQGATGTRPAERSFVLSDSSIAARVWNT